MPDEPRPILADGDPVPTASTGRDALGDPAAQAQPGEPEDRRTELQRQLDAMRQRGKPVTG